MIPQFKDVVFYEIYPNSFKDSDGDGFGDIQGIISKLDYVKELGFSGIWLNPIYDSPFLDGGYDIRDFFKVSPRFGTNEDLKQLVDECHKRGIILFLDLVPGHSSYENPEFLKSAEPAKNEYSDLFIWNDNVWANEPGYRLISGMFQRNGCYMVNFFSHQPAINYGFNEIEHPSWQVKVGSESANKGKKFIESVMSFYLDMGVDGFRVDMADSLVKNDGTTKVETIKLWQQIRKEVGAKHPNFKMTSEWSNPEQSLQATFDSDFVLDHWTNCSHMLFRKAEDGKKPLLSVYDAELYQDFVKDMNWRVEMSHKYNKHLSFISGNHDTIRIANYLNDEELRLAYLFILTSPGVPYIYFGDEIGMHSDTSLPSFEGGFHRTGSRTPMRFDESKNAGFSSADKTFLPTNESDSTAATMAKDPSSLYNFIKSLVALRNLESDLRSDDFEFIPDTIMCYSRKGIKVYMNITDKVQTHKVEGEVLLGTGKYSVEDGVISLTPHSAVIVK